MLTGLLATATLLAPVAGAQPPAAPAVLPPSVAPQVEAAPVPRAGDPANLPPAVAPPSVYPTDPRPLAGEYTESGRRSVVDTHLGPPQTIWAGVDYMRYWLRPAPLPTPLLANGSGATLVGGGDVELSSANGIQATLGVWLNDRHTFGLAGSGFLLEQRSRSAVVASDAGALATLVRPTVDALTGKPSAVVVATPPIPGVITGGLTGALGVDVGSRLSGFDGYAIHNVAYTPNFTFDLQFGGRYLDLDEYLNITQVSTGYNGTQVPFGGRTYTNATVTVNDRFRTRNQFFGGFMGFRTEYRFGPAFLGLTARVGIGNNSQTVNVDGSSAVNVPGVAPLPGGVLTAYSPQAGQPGNIPQFSGQSDANQFAVLSEVGATGGVQFARWGRLLVGYDFLYLNNVVRPGLQVDQVVNGRLLPISNTYQGVSGVASPRATGTQGDFYAHGVRIGLEVQY